MLLQTPFCFDRFQLGKWRRRRYDGIVLRVQLGEGHFESASIPKLLSQHISPKKHLQFSCIQTPNSNSFTFFFYIDSLEVFVHDEGTFSAQGFSGKNPLVTSATVSPTPSDTGVPWICASGYSDDDTHPQFPDASVSR